MVQELKTAVSEADEHKHPLIDFVPRLVHSFDEWMARWKSVEYLYEKLGLLHLLTSEDVWWWKDGLLSFLLETADGYCSESNFYKQSWQSSREHVAKNRKMIAEKAFSVLCQRFFKDGVRYENPAWWWMLKDEPSFKKVLWFLRREDGYLTALRNYKRIGDDEIALHPTRVFHQFLKKFTRLGWEFHSLDYRSFGSEAYEAIRRWLIAARPQFIDILCQAVRPRLAL